MVSGGISSETTNFILKIVFVLLAIVILYIINRRHLGFTNWIKGLTSGSTAGAVKAAAGVTGPNVFQVVREIAPTDDTRLW